MTAVKSFAALDVILCRMLKQACTAQLAPNSLPQRIFDNKQLVMNRQGNQRDSKVLLG